MKPLVREALSHSILLVPIALLVTGFTVLKHLATDIDIHHLDPTFFCQPLAILTFTMLVARVLVWLYILKKFDLAFAYPVTSLSYVFILCTSHYFFHEQIAIWQMLAALFIIIGVFFIYLGDRERRKVSV